MKPGNLLRGRVLCSRAMFIVKGLSGFPGFLGIPALAISIGFSFHPLPSWADTTSASNTVSWLVNIDFGTGTVSEKTGFAAVGQATNDF
jgi:hypothetical protein